VTRLLVGCPVSHREWIIRRWADHILIACERAGLEPSFITVAHPEDPTPAVLGAHLGERDLTVIPTLVASEETARRFAYRLVAEWNPPRYEQMAAIRNVMLDEVRRQAPQFFLSVDSDVLLHGDAVTTMMGLVADYGAVGSACFLSRPPGRRADGEIGSPNWTAPNYAMLDRAERVMRKWQPNLTRRVDVLMAVKLMTPAAYKVDYEGHYQGEDIGWALACRRAGVRFGWTSTVVSKHVMVSRCAAHLEHDPSCFACVEPLDRTDPRCGY